MRRTERPAVHHGDARIPTRARMAVVGILFFLLIVSIVPWRSQTIYDGGLDAVVVAKAALAALTLALTALLWMRTRVHMPIGLGPAFVLGVALLVTVLGALVAGNSSATIVLVVRVFIVMATILLLLSCVPWLVGLSCLLTSMGVLAVIAAITGVRTLASEGRLGGGIPEIHPNELAGLCAPPLIALIVYTLRHGVLVRSTVAIIALLAIVVASGSRIALVGILVGTVLAVLTNGVRDRSVVYALLGALPLAYAIGAFTGIIGDLASRGGSNAADTALDSRLDGWTVVLGWDWGSWEKWIGLGLSVKTIDVNLKWRATQVLDSSWISVLAQVGVIGALLLASLVIWCVASAVVSTGRRGILLPLVGLIITRSVTESGLLDSAMPFVLLVTVATLLTHRSRHADEMLAGRRDLPSTSEVRPAAVGLG